MVAMVIGARNYLGISENVKKITVRANHNSNFWYDTETRKFFIIQIVVTVQGESKHFMAKMFLIF